MSNEDKNTNTPAKTTTTAVKRVEGKLPVYKRIFKWFRELKSELKKVVWPTPKQVVNGTEITLAIMAVSAVVLWGFDSLASAGISLLIDFVG